MGYYTGTVKTRSALGPVARRSGFSKALRGKGAVNSLSVKSWEIIADNLSKAGWSWGCVWAIDRKGRTLWIAEAHRDDGKRFVVRADEQLTAFVELERAIRLGFDSKLDPTRSLRRFDVVGLRSRLERSRSALACNMPTEIRVSPQTLRSLPSDFLQL